MSVIYSIYEVKARFSEVIRQLRSGKTVTASYRGEPVAEIRTIPRETKLTLDERLRDQERREPSPGKGEGCQGQVAHYSAQD